MTTVRRAQAQDGLTLVEMLVALVVMSIVLMGVAMTTINSLQLSRSNADRGVAANLVASEMDRLRAMTFEDLVTLVVDEDSDEVSTDLTENVAGIDYDVTSRVYWAPNRADPGPCAGEASASDDNVLRVDVVADWNNRRTELVQSETTVAPPIGLYDPNAGTLAVFVQDHQLPPEPVQGVQVSVQPVGGGPTRPGSTNENGCAIFDGLPSGDYRASLNASQHIDIDQRVNPNVTDVQGVQPGARSTLQFTYSRQGTLRVTAAGWGGGDLPVTPLPWYFANTRGVYPGGGESGSSRGVFAGDYQLYAGTCPTADPEGATVPTEPTTRFWPDATRGDAVTVPSGPPTVNATATIGSLEVRWTPTSVSGRALRLYAQHVGDCTDGLATLDLGPITSGTGRDIALPFGRWRITAGEDGTLVADGGEITLSPLEQAPPRPRVTLDLEPPPVCAAPTPQVIGSRSASTGSANYLQVTAPPGTVAGDLLVVDATGAGMGSWWMQGTGWSRQYVDSDGPGLGTWTKIATGADLGTLRLNFGANREAAMTVTSLRGARSADPFELARGSGTNITGSFGIITGGRVVIADRSAPEEGLLHYAVSTTPARSLTPSPAVTLATSNRRLGAWSEAVTPGPIGQREVTWSSFLSSTTSRAHMMIFRGGCE